MARTKEFDPKRALTIAMDVFWRLGYENASLGTLLSAMGIAKQSMYDTYGDKRALFFLAMDEYREMTQKGVRRLLADAPSVKDGFAALLFGIAQESPAEQARGCLPLSAVPDASRYRLASNCWADMWLRPCGRSKPGWFAIRTAHFIKT